ncbi:hypothetical protein G5714_023328 [Onychostoma macrolepis]|uniref:Uncharacterized protein n=1 Tax=Onychostoma macrolepis TaxID=369639 RepID=A0A7J6BN81_9TELE|nr:hypothetical protein G5714_023328 [Onychostoma macrolepis]
MEEEAGLERILWPLLEAINKGLGQTDKSLFKHRAEAPLMRMFTNAGEKTRANRDVDTWPSTPPSAVLSPPPLMGQPGLSFLPSSRRQQSDMPAMTSRPEQAARDAFVELYGQQRDSMFHPLSYLTKVLGLAALGLAGVTIGAFFAQK